MIFLVFLEGSPSSGASVFGSDVVVRAVAGLTGASSVLTFSIVGGLGDVDAWRAGGIFADSGTSTSAIVAFGSYRQGESDFLLLWHRMMINSRSELTRDRI